MSELQDMAEAINNHLAMIEEAKAAAGGMTMKTSCSTQDALQKEQQGYLLGVLKDLAGDGDLKPGQMIRRGLTAFTQVEAKAFIVQNVLESVKGGKSLTDTLKHYHAIGFTAVNPVQLRPTADGTQPKNGVFLVRIWESIKKVAGIIAKIIVNAIKTAPEMVGVKPSIGIAMGFPSISFEIEPESKNFKEIWETLRAAF